MIVIIGLGRIIQRISQGLKVSRPALYDYLAFLEGKYFIKTIRPFSKEGLPGSGRR
jgi:hypothetical protein